MTLTRDTRIEILALVVKHLMKTEDGRAAIVDAWIGIMGAYSKSPAGMKKKKAILEDFCNEVASMLSGPESVQLYELIKDVA